ncbi:NAD-P-binding protein [Suillus bovinus]|uniref:NAD-P-binding protein n=1 Tax=Suillus bovinus TaxID=48563 RepID=UPI001B870101|nr:NAD-P-binding protein [Suillus bovinus]KAG2136488.1 NAD-P-binding protein [Suillus bovinus]
MEQSSPRVWLITGSSSGFGREMTEEVLLSQLCASPPSLMTSLPNIRALSSWPRVPLDTSMSYNNAGQVSYQELEGMSSNMDRARELMDINFWGAVTVSLEAVRFFREENPKGYKGMLIQVSSAAAISGVPLLGFYNATKAALDSFTEVLAQEVLPAWNIRFLNVHPGWTRTPITSSEMLEPPAAYASEPAAVTTKMRAGFDAFIESDALASVEAVTKRIFCVMWEGDEYLRQGEQDGIPGLTNLYVGMDSLELVHTKIRRLQGYVFRSLYPLALALQPDDGYLLLAKLLSTSYYLTVIL